MKTFMGEGGEVRGTYIWYVQVRGMYKQEGKLEVV